MIGKLKHRCGAQFTGKMEGMMNDLAVGLDHQKEVRFWPTKCCCLLARLASTHLPVLSLVSCVCVLAEQV